MRWIKCSERMPEPHTPVLAYREGRYGAQMNIETPTDIGGELWWNICGYGPIKPSPSHWCKLPEPPND